MAYGLLRMCLAILLIILIVKLARTYINCYTSYSVINHSYKDRLSLTIEDRTSTRLSPLIFVGGVPRSGTTLMRALLDAHPDIRCGEETHAVPIFLDAFEELTSKLSNIRLVEAGLTLDILRSAAANFLLEIIVRHGEAAPRLCNKDPYVLSGIELTQSIFPNAKFLLMIRDGRAVAHSIMIRSVGIKGFNSSTQASTLISWNENIKKMVNGCESVGEDACMKVYYEQLVLHPEATTKAIFKFIGEKWTVDLLKHEEFIGKPGGISLSKVEHSTSQVVKPINIESLTKWVDWLEPEVRQNVGKLAPMMISLGYDITSHTPNYGSADKIVEENSKRVVKEKEFWDDQVARALKKSKAGSAHIN